MQIKTRNVRYRNIDNLSIKSWRDMMLCLACLPCEHSTRVSTDDRLERTNQKQKANGTKADRNKVQAHKKQCHLPYRCGNNMYYMRIRNESDQTK